MGTTRTEQIWWTTTALLVALLAATVALPAFDRRLIDGATVWAKPMKFELSLALHFATLSLIAGALDTGWRHGILLQGVAWASAACALFEIAYIVLQAARQEPSHFNLSTPFHVAMYAAMAAGAVVITAAAAIVGLAALLDDASRLGPATRVGAAIGLIGGTVLTLVIAFRMGGALSHHVGVEPAGAPRMPLTGCSLAVGDRRAPHFFATHMMQAVPLAGLGLDRLLGKGPAVAAVLLVAAAWVVLTLALFRQANAGVPLMRWPS
ncbi:MAG: hypothetical protein ISP49_13490 [Reyranella sp.]|nr:hypothetical protein [Reyranella sp.]